MGPTGRPSNLMARPAKGDQLLTRGYGLPADATSAPRSGRTTSGTPTGHVDLQCEACGALQHFGRQLR